MRQATEASGDTQEKITGLKKLYKQKKEAGDIRGALRAKALIAYYKGMELETVAACYDVSGKSVKRWVKRYEKTGEVKDRPRSGRKRQLTAAPEAELKKIISQEKERVWVARQIYVLLVNLFGVCYSLKYLPELLRRLGLSWRKAEHELRQQDRRKRQEWYGERLPQLYQQQIEEGWRLFYQDEVGFQTDGTLSHTWGEKGEKRVVKNYGRRARVNLLGALELVTGIFHGVLTQFNVNAMRFRRFLCHLKREMRHDKLLLICDNAKFHHARWLTQWLESQQAWLQVVFLPAYSPDFNPIERLWRWLKREYTHNRCWASQVELKAHLKQMLAELPHRTSQYITVMKKERRRWLYFVRHYFHWKLAWLICSTDSHLGPSFWPWLQRFSFFARLKMPSPPEVTQPPYQPSTSLTPSAHPLRSATAEAQAPSLLATAWFSTLDPPPEPPHSSSPGRQVIALGVA